MHDQGKLARIITEGGVIVIDKNSATAKELLLFNDIEALTKFGQPGQISGLTDNPLTLHPDTRIIFAGTKTDSSIAGPDFASRNLNASLDEIIADIPQKFKDTSHAQEIQQKIQELTITNQTVDQLPEQYIDLSYLEPEDWKEAFVQTNLENGKVTIENLIKSQVSEGVINILFHKDITLAEIPSNIKKHLVKRGVTTINFFNRTENHLNIANEGKA